MARFLCTADLHIGRYSSVGTDTSGDDYSALATWERIAEMAIAEQADAVLVAGDFYDSASAQYESRKRVKGSLEKLRARGIVTLAVAGNHDHHALLDFASLHRDLIYVFPPGQWDEYRVKGVRILGRSFPKEYHRDSMLCDFHSADAAMPTVGLVHADVQGQGDYGPTPLADFANSGVSAWVVGHVHAPQRYLDGQVVYPGSPQALDWGETGDHGVCWLEIGNGQPRFGDLVPISSACYQYTDVRLAQHESLDEALLAKGRELRTSKSVLSIQFRVDLRLDAHDERQFPSSAPLENDWYEVCSKSRACEVNLEAEAQQPDAKGQAARLLLGLEGKGKIEWQDRASQLVLQLQNRMSNERGKLRLPQSESVRVLCQAGSDDAAEAVRRMLERILMIEGNAQ